MQKYQAMTFMNDNFICHGHLISIIILMYELIIEIYINVISLTKITPTPEWSIIQYFIDCILPAYSVVGVGTGVVDDVVVVTGTDVVVGALVVVGSGVVFGAGVVVVVGISVILSLFWTDVLINFITRTH